VIGAAQHLFRGAELHQIAAVHHRHLVGDVGDHPHVMGHQHAAYPALFAQVADELEDLILMETSSAVVGSSAMMSSGSPERAMAITTRWRMPPENW
jgi:hypothetical protein